jgi:hypothetical protein
MFASSIRFDFATFGAESWRVFIAKHDGFGDLFKTPALSPQQLIERQLVSRFVACHGLIAPFPELPNKHGVESLRGEISVPRGRQFEHTEDHLVIHAAELLACRVSTVLLDGELLDPQVIVPPVLCEAPDYVK